MDKFSNVGTNQHCIQRPCLSVKIQRPAVYV